MANKKRALKQLVANTCVVCGKKFMSAKPATMCTDNSTCRVKAYQAKKQSEKIAKKFMLDMEAYQVYMAFVERFPHLKEQCDAIIFDLGADNAAKVLHLMWNAIYWESTKKSQ